MVLQPAWLGSRDLVDDAVDLVADALDLAVPGLQDVPAAEVDRGVDLVDVALQPPFRDHLAGRAFCLLA